MDKVLKFLKDAETYYLATVEGEGLSAGTPAGTG